MDLSLSIGFQVRRGNDLRRQRKYLRSWEDDAIETYLHPSLAHEVSRLLEVFEMPAKLRPPREQRMPKGRDVAQITKHGVAHLRGLGREVGLRNSTRYQCSGGDDLVASSSQYAGRNTQQNCQQEIFSGHRRASPRESSLRSAPQCRSSYKARRY